MFCTKCGTQNDDNVQYCTNCGEALEKVEETTEAKHSCRNKKIIKLIIAAAVIILAVLGLKAVFGGKSEVSLVSYSKGDNVYALNWGDKEGSKIKDMSYYESDYGLSYDGKSLYYVTEDYELVYASLDKLDEYTVIDESVTNFYFANDGKLLVYTKDNGNRYVSEDVTKKGFKLATTYGAFSEDYKKFAYVDDSTLYIKDVEENADRIKIAEEVDEIIYDGCFDSESIYYIDLEENLCVWNGQESTVIAGSVYNADIKEGVVFCTGYEESDTDDVYSWYTDYVYNLYYLDENNEKVMLGEGFDSISLYANYAITYEGENEDEAVYTLFTPKCNVIRIEGASEVSFSEDYKKIYALEKSELYVYDVNGNEVKNKTKIVDNCISWYETDGKVLIEGEKEAESEESVIGIYDGKKYVQIADDAAKFYGMTDNNTVYYSNVGGDFFKQKIGKKRELILSGVYDAVVSPDGKTVYYISDWDEVDAEGNLYKKGVDEPVAKNVTDVYTILGY